MRGLRFFLTLGCLWLLMFLVACGTQKIQPCTPCEGSDCEQRFGEIVDSCTTRSFRRVHEPLTGTDYPVEFFRLRPFDDGKKLIAQGQLTPDERSHIAIIDVEAESKTVRDLGAGQQLIYALETERVAFIGTGVLKLVDLDTQAVTTISENEFVTRAWFTADQSALLYTASFDDPNVLSLFLAPVDGTAPTNLTEGLGVGTVVAQTGTLYEEAWRPVFLADKSRVVFLASPNEDMSVYGLSMDLYSVQPDGSDPIRLTMAASTGGTLGNGTRSSRFHFKVVGESNRIVYIADENTVNVKELFAIDADGLNPQLLSGTMVTGGNIAFKQKVLLFRNQNDTVLFAADRETDGTVEIFSVGLNGLGLQKISDGRGIEGLVRLTAADRLVFSSANNLHIVDVTGGTIQDIGQDNEIVVGRSILFSADDARVLYAVREGSSRKTQLWSSDLDDLKSRQLSPVSVDFSAGAPEFTPDGLNVLYLAQPEDDNAYVFYFSASDGSSATPLSPPARYAAPSAGRIIHVGRDHLYFGFPRLRYRNDQLFDYDMNTKELSNLSEELPQAIVDDAYVSQLQESKSGRFISFFSDVGLTVVDRQKYRQCQGALPSGPGSLYRSQQTLYAISEDIGAVFITRYDTDQKRNYVYRVELDDCSATRLDDDGMTISNFLLSPDEQALVFMAQEGSESGRLYASNTDGINRRALSQAAVQGGTLTPTINGAPFILSQNSNWVVYWGTLDSSSVTELYSTSLDGTQTHKLNAPLVNDGEVKVSTACVAPQITPDSNYVVYPATQETIERVELFRSRLDGSDNLRLSTEVALAQNAIIRCDVMSITANSTHVVFLGEDDSGALSIYSVRMDGTEQVRLYNAPADEGINFLLADRSDTVLYWSRQSNAGELYAIDIDGKNRRKLSGEGTVGQKVGTVLLNGTQDLVAFRSYNVDTDESILMVAALAGNETKELVRYPARFLDWSNFILSDHDQLLFIVRDFPRRTRRAYGADILSGEIYPLADDTPGFVHSLRLSQTQQSVFLSADFSTPGVLEIFEADL